MVFVDGHIGRYLTTKLRYDLVTLFMPARPGSWGLRDEFTGKPVLWLTP